ncbi:MAG: UvrB/UvrC motif-containing protein [Clostridia bacterium]|nr:UvrB/UvrC motif-containing protein [Clostridia bacterium]
MLCEKCKKRTATVFYNENLNGKTRSYSLCGECAAKLREKGDLQDITSMIGSFADPFADLHDDLFGGFFGMPTLKSVHAEKKCPTCGCSYSDIAREGRVGCADCYVTFENELSRTLQSVHGTTSHTGAVPSRHRARQARAEQLKRLKTDMQDAIAKEDFERAAALRDEIRKLEADGNGKDGE